MIDVASVLRELPHFEKFCSVADLQQLAEHLGADPSFEVRIAGASRHGIPIHHVRCGKGAVKALLVGFPHCKEPICGLTVYSLLMLLHQGHPALIDANVEWHVIPCIDPDGAKLNEGWTQQPVTMERYMRGFYVQDLRDQVDGSFPVAHKRLHWTQPSLEADLLQRLLEQVQPDFFYTLHNAWTGGAFYYLSRDVDPAYHRALYRLLDDVSFPLQKRPFWRDICSEYAPGIVEIWSIRKHYDHLEKTIPEPEKHLRFGGASWDYLEHIKPAALTFVTELGYVRHPSDESERPTGENLRRFRLQIDAESKYLASVLLELWDQVQQDVDTSSPLYRAVVRGGVLPEKNSLIEGGRPLSMHPTRDVLLHPHYDRLMTEGDRFHACIVDSGFWFLCHSYQLVRLMRESPHTERLERAIERAERAFDEALAQLGRYVDLSAFTVVDYDTLAKVQLGSGLIVLNSLLERHAR